MLKILAPTDFSTDGYNATLVAMQLARRFASDIILVHAMAKPTVPAAAPESIFRTLYDEAKSETRNRLLSECQHLLDILDMRHGEVQLRTLVVPTPFAESMIQVIAREKIDLVVMGRRGGSNIRHILMGSNTLELMQRSPVPVLVIPSDVVFDGFRDITILLEEKSFAHPSGINLLERLARSYNARLQFLKLSKDGKANQDITELLGNPADWQFLLELPHTTSTAADLYGLFQLEQQSSNKSQRLLVLTPERRSLWEEIFTKNLAEELAAQAKIPLLVLPVSRKRHA